MRDYGPRREGDSCEPRRFFPRHRLLDLPSRVLLVRYRANGFIERRVAAYAKPSHAFANS